MSQNMVNVFIMLGGIMLVMAIVALLDWLGERKEKRSRGSS